MGEEAMNARPKRPYTRCQRCGCVFPGAHKDPLCDDCENGQRFLFGEPEDFWPPGFRPVYQRGDGQ